MTDFELYILAVVCIVAILEGVQVHLKASLLSLMRSKLKDVNNADKDNN